MNIRSKIISIKDQVSIVQVLHDSNIYVSDGVSTQIKCFAHSDVHPSARVYTDTNAVYCWTCNKLFDVIAAYMVLNGVEGLPVAVDKMVAQYSVIVKPAAEQVEKFHAQAQTYHHGDMKRIKRTVEMFGTRFRVYYENIVGYKNIYHIIDSRWHEYDALYIDLLTATELLRRGSEWYYDSISLVHSYKEQCIALEELKQSTIKSTGASV